MLEAVSLKTLVASPKYRGGAWLDNGRRWSREAIVGLKLLVESGTEIEMAAASLGRQPITIAHRAYDDRLKMPAHWRSLITKRKMSEPRADLQYPFILKVNGRHDDLLAVNALVPHGLPNHLRADICQEIMLAIWQKQTSIEELRRDKALVNSFIRGAKNLNYEGGGYALSLDMPMRDGRSWYDVLPDLATLAYGD